MNCKRCGRPAIDHEEYCEFHVSGNAKGPRIRLYLGGHFYPMTPEPGDVEIRDIAHSLALKCRFTGHSRKFYSVAEHAYRVCDIVARKTSDPDILLSALLHDAAEAYLTDVAAPYKPYVRIGHESFKEVEDRILHAVFQRFDIPHVYDLHPSKLHLDPLIKAADDAMFMTERRDLMHHDEGEVVGADFHRIVAWPANCAEEAFLRRFWGYVEVRDARDKKNLGR